MTSYFKRQNVAENIRIVGFGEVIYIEALANLRVVTSKKPPNAMLKRLFGLCRNVKAFVGILNLNCELRNESVAAEQRSVQMPKALVSILEFTDSRPLEKIETVSANIPRNFFSDNRGNSALSVCGEFSARIKDFVSSAANFVNSLMILESASG